MKVKCPECESERVVQSHSAKEYRCLNCGRYFKKEIESKNKKKC